MAGTYICTRCGGESHWHAADCPNGRGPELTSKPEPVREIRGRRVLTCGGVTLHGHALVSDRNGPFTLAFLADGHAEPWLVDTRVWRVSFEPSGWRPGDTVPAPSAPRAPVSPVNRTWTPDMS